MPGTRVPQATGLSAEQRDQIIDATYALVASVADGADLLVDAGVGDAARRADRGRDLGRMVLVEHGCVPTGSSAEDGVWDLDSPAEVETLLADLDGESVVVVAHDILRRLRDPRPVLRALRAQLKRRPASRAVITVWPSSGRPGGEAERGGSLREWGPGELSTALQASGFVVTHRRDLPCSGGVGEALVLAAAVPALGRTLQISGGGPEVTHLILTTEHTDAGVAGGIGSYCAAVAGQLDGVAVLYTGGMGLDPTDLCGSAARLGMLHTASFQSHRTPTDNGPDPYGALEAVLHLLFLEDSIRVVEFQDFLGIGAHVAQAKRAGLIPPSVTTVCYAHGSCQFLDSAAGVLEATRDPFIDARERISLENADLVLFPSEFAKDVYLDVLAVSPRRWEVQQPPAGIPVAATGDRGPSREIDSLVYIGRDTTAKGCDLLGAALLHLQKLGVAIPPTLLMFGLDAPPAWATALRDVDVVTMRVPRADLQSRLNELAEHALAVLPYPGESHSIVLGEVIGAGLRFVATAAGAIPEQLRGDFGAQVLAEPDPESLASAVARACREPVPVRDEVVRAVTAHYSIRAGHAEDRFRRLSRSLLDERPDHDVHRGRRSPSAVSVIIPVFRGNPEHLSAVGQGLAASTCRPHEVIVVDDGSPQPWRSDIERAVANDFADLPVRLVRLDVNSGLAAARNEGLRYCSGDLVLAHDGDNVVYPGFLSTASRVLQENETVAAVTAWADQFVDGASWWAPDPSAPRLTYEPLGPDLGLGLQRNIFGDALAVYRVSALRQVGGWDASSRAKWEDWELLLRLALGEWDIAVVPREEYGYRIRSDSMLRTYPDLPGWRRLWEALPVPRSQQLSLLRAVLAPPVGYPSAREVAELRREKAELERMLRQSWDKEMALHAQIEQITDSRSWRMTGWLRRVSGLAGGSDR